jgi:hypothetical protein
MANDFRCGWLPIAPVSRTQMGFVKRKFVVGINRQDGRTELATARIVFDPRDSNMPQNRQILPRP